MSAPKLAATILYTDAKCAKTVQWIQYTYPNSTDCTAASVSSTCAPIALQGTPKGYYATSACVTDISTFGNTYFNKTVPQVQTLNTGTDCAGQPTGGFQVLLDACVPASSGESTKITIESTNGALYRSVFSDSTCTNFKDIQLYGSVKNSTCQNSMSISLLNYQGLFGVTTYTGSDCSKPAKVGYGVSLDTCTETSACTQNGVGEYINSVCSSQADLNGLATKAFAGSPYFVYQSYVDSQCVLLGFTSDIRLNTCFSTSPNDDGSIQSCNTTLSDDGSSITILYYSASNCQGTLVSNPSFPTNGGCKSSQKVFYSKDSFQAVGSPNSNNTDSSSSSNIGAIVGGAVGGALVLGLVAFVVYRVVRPKKDRLPFNNTSSSPPEAPVSPAPPIPAQPRSPLPVPATTLAVDTEARSVVTSAVTSAGSSGTFLVSHGVNEKQRDSVFGEMNSMASTQYFNPAARTVEISPAPTQTL
ncbi:hypothetical protein BCR33DRAFT_851742 [Rhizoclosmatium globosum]|uniref:Uncharacterized protein n=1 Tax=Rhizoclosmatium globosum TaxID=329046 RepID=A0A1Y2C5A2_9FUNG|nr:hypothetical protein BCR33DRAFT_851742 [Rhizoclosmatium globosum]|eukprot:ORY42208.1 hypothetical protein BCR33DRAFT_851742 [Rhizoclosmatium globosum]